VAGKPGQGRTVFKRKELMMSLQLCICCRVQVTKMVITLKKTMMIPLKKIQKKTTPCTQSVTLGMVIANATELLGDH